MTGDQMPLETQKKLRLIRQANLERNVRKTISAYLNTYTDDEDMVKASVDTIMAFVDAATYRVEA